MPSVKTDNYEILRALKEARALIEQGWTKGAYARNKAGRVVELNRPEAARFCLAGAYRRVAWDDGALSNALWYELMVFLRIRGYSTMAGFNDSQSSKKPILRLYDQTIKHVESRIANS